MRPRIRASCTSLGGEYARIDECGSLTNFCCEVRREHDSEESQDEEGVDATCPEIAFLHGNMDLERAAGARNGH